MWLLQRIGERLLGSVDRLQRAFHRSPPAFRRGAAMLVDALIVIESFAVTLLFRFAGNVDPAFWRTFWPFAGFSALAFARLKASAFSATRGGPGRSGGRADAGAERLQADHLALEPARRDRCGTGAGSAERPHRSLLAERSTFLSLSPAVSPERYRRRYSIQTT